MITAANTLYVTTQGAYLGRDHETVAVRVERETKLAVPLHHLAGIVCFGRISASPDLLGTCAERGITVSFLTEHGKFLARMEGPVSGNVLLRRAQYRAADDAAHTLRLARSFVIGKVANARTVLRRAAREHTDPTAAAEITAAGDRLDRSLAALDRTDKLTSDEVRGHEGEAASNYFGVLDRLILSKESAFRFSGRNRRPPLDPPNAVMSFLYALLLHDASGALQAVGLDPAVGYLHVDRPGRPSLALDLMEEFRAFIADRVALSVMNFAEVKPDGFRQNESGGCEMHDETRKVLLVAYQRRKQEAIMHPLLKEQTTVGLLPHIQARLLARTIRGELDPYPPFVAK